MRHGNATCFFAMRLAALWSLESLPERIRFAAFAAPCGIANTVVSDMVPFSVYRILSVYTVYNDSHEQHQPSNYIYV